MCHTTAENKQKESQMTRLTNFAVAGVLIFGVAAFADQEITTASIETQIEAIKQAPKEERANLMNQLKQQIATMSPQERQEVMQELHLQMRAKEGNEHANDQEAMQLAKEMRQERMREHSGEMQNEASKQYQHQQEFSQREAGEQYRHENGNDMSEHGRNHMGRRH
jgi:Mg/Co/Ni transporter MgtE